MTEKYAKYTTSGIMAYAEGVSSARSTFPWSKNVMTPSVGDGGLDVIDTIRTEQGTTVDSNTLLLQTQKRVWAALKENYQYAGMPDDSNRFLRNNVLKRFNAVVLYVDLVGSTKLALDLPEEKLAIILSSFTQEMASVVAAYGGLVLKFVGDAVIGYFLAAKNSLLAADRAVSCAKSMLTVIREGINPILEQYYYPELQVRIGIDHGENIVVKYGMGKDGSHVDLIGRSMNMAAKIQSMAKPNQILVGEHVYIRLHPSTQKEFEIIIWEDSIWVYRSTNTGGIYKVYVYKEHKHSVAKERPQ